VPEPTCYMKLKGQSCIKATAADPKSIICEQCLWNMKKQGNVPTKAMEKLYSRYHYSA